MFRLPVKEESGIALALAIIMIVLIGVLGAGLLAFVRRDLEAVIKVNQGQRAFEIAEAGVQVAKQQLLLEKSIGEYDVDTGTDPDYYGSACDVAGESASSEWSPEGEGSSEGVTRGFAGGSFNVTIRWLSADPAAPTGCEAPEATPEVGVDYFQVFSTGTYGEGKRTIEAIYETHDLGVPRGFFTPRGIEISDAASVQSVGLFSLQDVTIGKASTISGTDLAYGDWATDPATGALNPYNDVPRGTTAAGIGAEGDVGDGEQVAGRDYDQNSSPSLEYPAKPGSVTFPFDPGAEPDLDILARAAEIQGNLKTTDASSYDLSDWPAGSTDETVVYVRFTGGTGGHGVDWRVPGGCRDDPPKRGTLVIENADFTIQPNTAHFDGVVLVRGGQAADGKYSADACFEGFVHAEGGIEIGGSVRSDGPQNLSERPGFYGLELWSWRECYSANCA
ncbi:MAG: hypothetical protein M3324_10470 [Actinomycetota bacterium]|nr:hypothetical protein [Actinomycetota bacterium]